jgi:SAM-dependent methyltransferase
MKSDQDFNDLISKSKILHHDASKTYWPGAFNPKEPDTQRHYHLLSSSDGLLDHLCPSSILSIGDNLARDAGFFKKVFPSAYCIASDLCTDGLEQAVEDGWIDSIFNADIESLPFKDADIDVVIAKESFHHWPRPMLGFYEMLRVAKKAVLLIEPFDVMEGSPVPFIPPCAYNDACESVGNYKYRLSLREILKSAWAMYLPAVAAVGLNDPYSPNRSMEEWLKEKEILDSLGQSGKRQFNLMCVVVYKSGYSPDNMALPAIARLYTRPRNPYTE